jgi:ribosomal protein S12 methylthiotransferase
MSERSPRPVRVGLVTLGCPKNTVDSEEMLRSLTGSETVDVASEADDAEIVVINTCAFIGPAKEESIETILQAVRRKQEGRHRGVVVVGCLSERYRKELEAEIPEVDAFLGVAPGSSVRDACLEVAARNRDLPFTPEASERSGLDAACHSESRNLAARLTPFYTAYLKISEGCDNPCTFCAIPFFRGRHRSRPPEALLAEARTLAEQGVVELNVIAQDTTSYGIDFAEGPRLHEILPAIAGTPGLRWTRLLYAYPRFFTDDLIEAIRRTEGICKYVDMPIQHASERVLRRMGRGMDRGELTRLIERMRSRIPGLVLRTTILVGFPGETEAEFEELLGFLRDARFERLGAFTYSHEDGTPAFRFPDDVPEEVKEERQRRVMELQQEIAFEANEGLVGGSLDVLVEAPDREAGTWIGRTYGDAPEIDGRIFLEGSGLAAGRIYRARVTGAAGYDLEGVVELVPAAGGNPR